MSEKYTVSIGDECYTAEYADGELYQIKLANNVGNIYRVKVRQIRGNIAFCDTVDGTVCVGLEGLPPRSALLDKGATPEQLQVGDIFMCQVVSGKTDTKEMLASSVVSLPGDLVVMVGKSIRFSKRIPYEQRSALAEIAEYGNDSGMGVLFRTACGECALGAVERELEEQVKRAKELLKTYKNAQIGDCIYRVNSTVLSDIPGVLAAKIKNDIIEAQKARVDIVDGAYLVINRTEGMTVVDVNSGRSAMSAAAINEDAARETKRQLVLRDVTGLVAIDFLKTKDEGFYEELKRVMTGFADVSELNRHGVVTLAIEKRRK